MPDLPEPKFVYKASQPSSPFDDDNEKQFPPLDGPQSINLGAYARVQVSNVSGRGRAYFDLGLRHMLCYQHEMATHCFLAAIHFSPDCALAHGLIALCHAPNYNFKGEAYYISTHHEIPEEEELFPSQQLADRHSKLALEKIEQLRKLHKGTKKGKKKKKQQPPPKSQDPGSPHLISDIESQVLIAIRTLTSFPGIDPELADETAGRPYADAMRKVYQKHTDDAEVAYFFAESLMVLNAWQLYHYPTGKPKSHDVDETRAVLETALQLHPNHPGLCHMYVHLSEMSSDPGKALSACPALRASFPHAGHLIHMATHIDVLVGDYEATVKYNHAAIQADLHCIESSAMTCGITSFYFGYIVHNYHMLVYGAILGGMEQIGMDLATELNTRFLTEAMFSEHEDLASYLEAYSALDVHVMVRFGRWKEILELELPQDKRLMLFRTASIYFARALALSQLGEIPAAKKEADRYDSVRKQEDATERILHNNQVSDLLAVDAPMVRGEIAYAEGQYDLAFKLLRKAVALQDGLHFDEPWGKMVPIRHALGGLLLEQNHFEEAKSVFKTDLEFHPSNPWALVGLISCLKRESAECCGSSKKSSSALASEISKLEQNLEKQRQARWADYNITVACACCRSDGTP